MKLRYECTDTFLKVHRGFKIRKGWGIAYKNHYMDTTVFYPIPLNYIVKWSMYLYCLVRPKNIINLYKHR